MEITVEIKGLDQLQKKLYKVSREVSKKILKTALKRAGRIIMGAMVQNSPVDSGLLQKHFGMRTKVLKQDIVGMAYVGPEGKVLYPSRGPNQRTVAVASVARFAEFGTKNQPINAFMTRAFESEKQNAMNAIIEEIQKALAEAVK